MRRFRASALWIRAVELLLRAPSIPRSLRKRWESTTLDGQFSTELESGCPGSLASGDPGNQELQPTSSNPARKLGVPAPVVPSFPRSFSKRWESTNLAFWIKSAQAVLLAVAVCFSAAASDSSARMENLSHRLMCQCGCAQLLGECDHVGCPDRDGELAELSAGVAAGESDQQILNGFVAKYGAVVLAAPTTHGFDLVAWIAPFAVFAAALLGTILLIRRWSGVAGVQAPAAAENSARTDPADRERRERIRRETSVDTGAEGGF